MHKILFICHGNICRSPMAEFLLKDIVKKRGIAADFEIASAATSREEIGNPVHHGTRGERLLLESFGMFYQCAHTVYVFAHLIHSRAEHGSLYLHHIGESRQDGVHADGVLVCKME